MSAPQLSPALVLAAAIVAGAAMDATIKHLTQATPVLLVVFGRYIFGALFSYLAYVHAKSPTITAEMWRAHLVRGVVIAVSGSGFFWGLTVLPLAEAVTLSFIGPLVIAFIAWAMLGERLRMASIGAAVFGFIGVIVAAQGAPSVEQSPMHWWGVTAVLFSACTFALAMVLMRQRTNKKDHPAIVALMSSVAPGIVIAIPAIAFSAPPNWADWPGFLLMGALAAGFMYLLTRAYANAEAQKIAPIHYTELIWATAFGYFLFDETPRPEIYYGAALIIAACLYVAYDNHRLTTRPAPETHP